jgi:catechol 2,3-dioxygenase-like lactoylglutathione lyase family enzyme
MPEIDVTPIPVLQIARIALNVADLERACAFYTDALGFRRLAGPAGGLPSQTAILALGAQEIELRLSAGRPYPQPRAANDPWFQHFAIAVCDMSAAYQRLSRYAQQPISLGGPQLLPPSTGSVTAYKFRDPEGHPLELSYIPGSAWLAKAADRRRDPCLGIDHSALAAADLTASAAFYTDILGFSPAGRGLNQGAEQDRLDGLAQARVDILSLKTAEGGPHIELLHYRSPMPSSAPRLTAPEDIAATRIVLRAANAADVIAKMAATDMSRSAPGKTQGPRALFKDPDGHWLEIFDQG